MNNFKKIIFILLLIFTPPTTKLYAAEQGLIKSLRSFDHENYSRFVIEVENYTDYEYFVLGDPHRLVIDVNKAIIKKAILKESHLSKKLKKSRFAQFDQNTYRIVLDLPTNFIVNRSFTISEKNKTKIVFDIGSNKDEVDYLAMFEIDDEYFKKYNNNKGSLKISKVPIPVLKDHTKFMYKPIIIIDAGHGGRDPGSMGRTGLREKDITLKYAKSLAYLLESTGKYKVHLTRNNDKYISLQQRIKYARSKNGDLFISLHADSHKNHLTRGLSVYTISEKASDKEAERMAAKENAADLMGDKTNLTWDNNSELNDLLFDLVQRNSKNHSSIFAQLLIKELGSNIRLLRNTHRFAGFRVLTSPDIPSVLIELGYLSNKQEEKLLKTDAHRQKLLKSVVNAVNRYFKNK